MSLPWDLPILLKIPLNSLPHGPQQPPVETGKQGEGAGAVVFLSASLGSLQEHPPSRGWPDTFIFLLVPSHWDSGQPSLSVTAPHWVSRPDTHLILPKYLNCLPPTPASWQKQGAGLGPQEGGGSRAVHTCGKPSLYQRHAVTTAHQLQVHAGQSSPFASELSSHGAGGAGS